MKLRLILFSAVCFLSNGCFLYQELPVEYDYSYQGRFNKYKSFDFMGLEYSPDMTSSSLIENSIISHMKLLGYKLKNRKPDLMISYRVYSDSLKLRGYNQPEIQNWAKSSKRNLDYDAKSLKLNNGTLFLQIYDRKKESPIWQGYATQEYGKINFENDRHVKNAVRSILDKYQFFAEGFLAENLEMTN